MLVSHTLVAAASMLIAVPALGQVDPFSQPEAKLTAPAPAANGYFGTTVAMSGDTLVLGAVGSAFVFVGGGATWSQQAQLTALDTVAGDFFGASVALSGDTALVGAQGYDNNTGSVYVFVRSGTVWAQQAKLTAADAAMNNLFGSSVSISGDTAVVGAYLANSAYVFSRSGTSWSQSAKLIGSDTAYGDYFGQSVAVSDQTAVIGAVFNDNAGGTDAGSAYVFVRQGSSWVQQAKLTALDAAADDRLGNSVSLSGDTALVGAMCDDNTSGSAYVFVRSGTAWSQQEKLTAPDAEAGDYFGQQVAVSGDTAVIGVPNDSYSGPSIPGTAFVFVRQASAWTQLPLLTSPDADNLDAFGGSVVVSGATVVVGIPNDDNASGIDAGAAEVFEVAPIGSWIALGFGLSGTAGIPALTGAGYMLAGSSTTVSLTHSKPFSLAPLVVGVGSLFAPFKGGIMVPSPDFIFPLFTDFFGGAVFGGLWPAGVPSGFSTYFQWWVQDPTGPVGFAASNAVVGTAP